MFSSAPKYNKKVSLPGVPSGETKKAFHLTKNFSQKVELNLYFKKNDFFPPCKFIARDVDATKKRKQFLALMAMIQGNCIEFVGDLRVFLSHYFDLNEDDLKNISEIIKHERPFLDSLPLIKKFYTDSVKNFLTALDYQSYELAVDWNKMPEIEPLLKEIVIDLASMGVFVEENQVYFPLSGFNLSHIQLPAGSNLSYRICRHTNFTGAVLTRANFQEAEATHATFAHADLQGADFTSATLLGAHFEHADLRGANLQGADLTDAHLKGAKLAGANLAGAELKWTRLDITDLVGWNFQDAILTDTFFEQNLPVTFNTYDVMTYLSHNAPNLLHALDSIPWQYESLKVRLMKELITRFANTSMDTRISILTHRATLNKILRSHPAYIQQSTTIAAFVQNVLVETPPLINQADFEAHYFTEQELTQLFADFIEPHVFAGYIPDFFSHYSAAINQILFACRGKSAKIQAQGKKLAELYQNALPQWIKSLCARDRINLTIDFTNTSDDYMMVFIPSPPHPITLRYELQSLEKQAVICSSSYYETHVLDRDKGTSWTDFQIITHNAANKSSYTHKNHIHVLFHLAPVFKYSFRKKNGFSLMGLFLRELNLPEQAHRLFVAAFSQPSFSEEQEDRLYFQDVEGEPRAQAIVEPWLKQTDPSQTQEEVQVSSSFINTMDRVFHCDDNKETRKIMLVLMSGVFAKLSSRVFYGTDESSVFFFRLLALACLNTAKAMPNPLPETWKLTRWQERLKDEDECSDRLSRDIILTGHSDAPRIVALVIPLIW